MLRIPALEQRIQEEMDAARIPGLALAVVQNLEVVYARGFGVTSVEDGGLPATPQTLFRIGSITKSLTATGILRLVEAGKVDLDCPVREYVPWITFSEAGAADRITLRRLLSHSAGLPTDHNPFGRHDPEALEVYVRDRVPGYRFIAPPGKLYAYSNPSICVAGYVAEAVGRRPYTKLMQELVFDPLEMARTTFDPTVAMTYPTAQSHDLGGDGRLKVQHRYADNAGSYPSGYAISTALDLTHFAIMQMDGGCFHGRRLLSPQSVVEMQTIQADQYTTADAGYGLGLVVDRYKGLRRAWHSGSISTFGSRLVMAPDAGAGVAVLVNRAPSFWDTLDKLTDGVLDQVLDLPAEAPKPQSTKPDRSLWPLYAGSYLGDWRGLATVRMAGEQLTLEWNGVAVPLSVYKGNTYFGYRSNGAPVSIGFVPENGQPVRYVLVNSSPCQRFEPGRPFEPDPAAWTTYAGRYMGVENLTLRVEGGRLLVHSEDLGQELPCVALSNTVFASDLGLLNFRVASDGKQPSLELGRAYVLDRIT